MKWWLAVLLLALAGPAMAQQRAVAPVLARDLFIRQETPDLSWRWRVAPEAGLEPGLLRAMRADAMAVLARERADARRAKADALENGYPFRSYETIIDWSVAADTKRLLVLKGLVWRYTGGAHGNTAYARQLWDREARRSLTFEALFLDWPRARRLLEPGYCAALEAERRKRRGDSGPMGLDFDSCPPLAEQLILPAGSLYGVRADGLLVILPPYVAGPYAEGSYELHLAWPQGVAALVKPEWRATLGLD